MGVRRADRGSREIAKPPVAGCIQQMLTVEQHTDHIKEHIERCTAQQLKLGGRVGALKELEQALTHHGSKLSEMAATDVNSDSAKVAQQPTRHHAAKELDKWKKRTKYAAGKVYVADVDGVPVQVAKELDSAAVCISTDGDGTGSPDLIIQRDELVQAIGIGVTTAGPTGKFVARLRIDCRSLIALRLDADELAPEPIDGWVSVFSSACRPGQKRPDSLLCPVPEEHIQKGVKKILQARGGYVEPKLLEQLEAEHGEANAAAAQVIAPQMNNDAYSFWTSGAVSDNGVIMTAEDACDHH